MRRLKFILNSLAIITILVSLALFINFYTVRVGLDSLPLDFETISPDKTYTVHVKELRKAHMLPFFSSAVDTLGSPTEFSVYKKGQPVIEKVNIGDDSNVFAYLYPGHAWISDSVLRLGDKDPDKLGHDEVVVTNKSKQAIAYLRVRTCKWEMFWLFDVQPGSTVKLSACAQTDVQSPLSWVASSGKFSDGREIPFAGRDFKIQDKYKASGHYLIAITDEGTRIDSADFESYN